MITEAPAGLTVGVGVAVALGEIVAVKEGLTPEVAVGVGLVETAAVPVTIGVAVMLEVGVKVTKTEGITTTVGEIVILVLSVINGCFLLARNCSFLLVNFDNTLPVFRVFVAARDKKTPMN